MPIPERIADLATAWARSCCAAQAGTLQQLHIALLQLQSRSITALAGCEPFAETVHLPVAISQRRESSGALLPMRSNGKQERQERGLCSGHRCNAQASFGHDGPPRPCRYWDGVALHARASLSRSCPVAT